jgi:hypothetical protein
MTWKKITAIVAGVFIIYITSLVLVAALTWFTHDMVNPPPPCPDCVCESKLKLEAELGGVRGDVVAEDCKWSFQPRAIAWPGE